jgi:ankyrin repeat protein
VEGDSILFTCIRKAWKRSQLDFFFAALEHTGEKDPRGWAGKNLLDVVVAERRIDGDILARLVESGVDLDMQTQSGSTTAMWAVRLDRPQLALHILKKGANPSIRNKKGQSVKDLILEKLEHEKGNPHYPKEDAARLLEWLENHSSDADSTGEEP